MNTVDAIVFGNATLDVICYPVDDVPRHDSISFESSMISPGGCGSNVAIGLSALGVPTAIIARLGSDAAGELVQQTWQSFNLETSLVQRSAGKTTGVSVGLVDRDLQPRFVHTPGANSGTTVDDLDWKAIASSQARSFHIAGFFVLPGLLDGRLPAALSDLQHLGLETSLDVVNSPRMNNPAPLWPCLPYLDIFMCNAHEAARLSGLTDPYKAASAFIKAGARAAIIKLGERGCWMASSEWSGLVPAELVEVVETTGAGDAFAAGLIAARLHGADLIEACRAGNAAGGRAVGALGAVACWQPGCTGITPDPGEDDEQP